MQFLIIITLVMALHSLSFAQGNVTSDFTNPSQTSAVKVDDKKQIKEKLIRANFYIESYNYSSAFDESHSQQNAYQENHLGLNLKYFNPDFYDLQIKTNFQTDLNRSQNTSFAIPEAFQTVRLSTSSEQVQNIFLGRSIHYTSDVDQRFHMGLIQPYFTQDHLSFETQGLTGFEYEMKINKVQIYAGAYPFFIPNQDPGVKVENGRVVAQNRWASQAPKYFVFNENKKDIVYEVKNYNISDIVMNPGFRLGTVVDTQSIWSQSDSLSIGFKRAPLNNIILSRETYADLEIQGQVKLAPVVNYSEQIYSDLKLNAGAFKIIYSILNDKPDVVAAQSEQSIQSMSAMTVQSLTLELPTYKIDELQQSTYISFALIDGGQIQDINSDGTNNIVTVSKHRQKYFRPIKIGSVNNFYLNFKNPLQTKVEYTYDSEQKGALLSFESRYSINEPTQIKFGLDVLGSDYSANAKDDSADYFLVKNQASDRVFAGVNYVY